MMSVYIDKLCEDINENMISMIIQNDLSLTDVVTRYCEILADFQLVALDYKDYESQYMLTAYKKVKVIYDK